MWIWRMLILFSELPSVNSKRPTWLKTITDNMLLPFVLIQKQMMQLGWFICRILDLDILDRYCCLATQQMFQGLHFQNWAFCPPTLTMLQSVILDGAVHNVVAVLCCMCLTGAPALSHRWPSIQVCLWDLHKVFCNGLCNEKSPESSHRWKTLRVLGVWMCKSVQNVRRLAEAYTYAYRSTSGILLLVSFFA